VIPLFFFEKWLRIHVLRVGEGLHLRQIPTCRCVSDLKKKEAAVSGSYKKKST